MTLTTFEPQYNVLVDHDRDCGREVMGLMSSHAWANDPKRLAFTLSRYKFVAKMLSSRTRVLEIGCGDAFGSRIVRQEVDSLFVADVDPVFIDDIRLRDNEAWPMVPVCHDFVRDGPLDGFDAVYSLDVLEHIPPDDEKEFLYNASRSLLDHGIAVIGTPSLQSQRIASPISQAGHVNCKTGPQLKELLEEFFHAVFLFSMNDEVVHTGHHEMAHYLFVACADKRAL